MRRSSPEQEEAASGSLSTRSVSRVGTVESSAEADSCCLPASALPSEVPPAAEAATQPSAQAAEFVSRVVPASSAAGDSEQHLAASKQLSALSPGEGSCSWIHHLYECLHRRGRHGQRPGSILASTAAQAQHHQQLQLLVQQNEEGEEPHKQRQPRLSTDSIVAAPTVKRSSDASDLGGVFLNYEGYGASPGEEQERQSSQASVPDETASNKCDLVRAELAVNAFKSKCGLMLPQQLCLGPMEAGAVVVGRLLLPRQHQEEQQGERPPHVERSGVRLVIGEELWNVLLPLFSHHIRPQPQHQQSKRLPPLLVVRPQLLCLQSRQQLLAHDGVFGIV
ncbi:hypothetical protein cyc_02243 [Cyclospora cayetanensis]|uniref:Uncharacterized protein n=1 Tax=Cyclospora cayetanensis TaxID=88456 RepID=A0A1D3D170_9EIME|nr:hypothetical protein cyc_02243 [Cyclospora cayetanensis]